MAQNEIVEKMVSLGLNEIVGGGDPIAVGEQNLLVLKHLARLTPSSNVLDFGCGCGRVAVPLLEFLDSDASYVGVDIVPVLLDFCQQEIAGRYDNAAFYQIQESNRLYEKFRGDSDSNAPMIESLADLGTQRFDVIAAFSVFTHLSFAESAQKLKELDRLLRPGGKLVISCFLANDSSRTLQEKGKTDFDFGDEFFDQEKEAYYIGEDGDLTAVAFEEDRLFALAREAHLDPEIIYYGTWCGRTRNETYQDILVLSDTSKLPTGFDASTYLKRNDDLPWTADEEGLEAATEHFLKSGYFEKRPWR